MLRVAVRRSVGISLAAFFFAVAAAPHHHLNGVEDLLLDECSDSGILVLAEGTPGGRAPVFDPARLHRDLPCLACFSGDFVAAARSRGRLRHGPVAPSQPRDGARGGGSRPSPLRDFLPSSSPHLLTTRFRTTGVGAHRPPIRLPASSADWRGGESLKRSVRFTRRLSAGFVLLFSAGLAAAQTPEPPLPWRLTISGVWYSGTTPYRAVGAVSGDVHFDSAAGWGVRLAHEILPWFDFGVGWNRVVAPVRLAGSDSTALGSRQINTIEGGGDFHWIRGPLRLSLMTGIGGANTGSKGGINLTASVGAGLSLSLDAARRRGRRGAVARDVRQSRAGDLYAFCDATVATRTATGCTRTARRSPV